LSLTQFPILGGKGWLSKTWCRFWLVGKVAFGQMMPFALPLQPGTALTVDDKVGSSRRFLEVEKSNADSSALLFSESIQDTNAP